MYKVDFSEYAVREKGEHDDKCEGRGWRDTTLLPVFP
jgi:hypothetical protein